MVKNRIKVYARLKKEARPDRLLPHDVVPRKDGGDVLTFYPGSRGRVGHAAGAQKFRFDRVFSTCSDQRAIFDAIAEPVIKGVMDGYNGTVFAYGPTGSGKTYSLTGSQSKYRNRGLIPRTIEFVFEFIARSADKYVIHISYLEIYNEVAYDLLGLKEKFSTLEELPRVLVMEDEKGEAHFKNLSVLRVSEVKDAMQLLFLGDTNRTIAETPLNEYSSRSHCVFTLHVTVSANEGGNLRRSKLNLVDLAGSERLNKLNLNGIMLSEAKYINLSLHYLEQVILALSDVRRAHVPFRNSVMTFMLRDSIAGNCLTAMLATLSVTMRNYEETLATCKFAQRVSLVKTDAVVNADSDSHQEISFLRNELIAIRRQLAEKNITKSEELSIKDKDLCKKMVKKYLKDGEDLCFDDTRKVKVYVELLKNEVLKKSKSPSLNVSEIERKYKDILLQKDEEISILTNIIETKIPLKISPQKQKYTENDSKSNYKKQSFEAFLLKFGHRPKIEFYTKTLDEKYKIATITSQCIVQAQTKIVQIRKIIDMGQKDCDTLEKLKYQLRSEQNNYKEMLMRLENVKHEIDYLHESMIKVKNLITKDFTDWQNNGRSLLNNIIEKENVQPNTYKFNIHDELDALFSKTLHINNKSNITPNEVYIKNNLLENGMPEYPSLSDLQNSFDVNYDIQKNLVVNSMPVVDKFISPICDLRNSLDLNFDIQIAKLLNPSKLKPTAECVRVAEHHLADPNKPFIISNTVLKEDTNKILDANQLFANNILVQENKNNPVRRLQPNTFIENKPDRSRVEQKQFIVENNFGVEKYDTGSSISKHNSCKTNLKQNYVYPYYSQTISDMQHSYCEPNICDTKRHESDDNSHQGTSKYNGQNITQTNCNNGPAHISHIHSDRRIQEINDYSQNEIKFKRLDINKQIMDYKQTEFLSDRAINDYSQNATKSNEIEMSRSNCYNQQSQFYFSNQQNQHDSNPRTGNIIDFATSSHINEGLKYCNVEGPRDNVASNETTVLQYRDINEASGEIPDNDINIRTHIDICSKEDLKYYNDERIRDQKMCNKTSIDQSNSVYYGDSNEATDTNIQGNNICNHFMDEPHSIQYRDYNEIDRKAQAQNRVGQTQFSYYQKHDSNGNLDNEYECRQSNEAKLRSIDDCHQRNYLQEFNNITPEVQTMNVPSASLCKAPVSQSYLTGVKWTASPIAPMASRREDYSLHARNSLHIPVCENNSPRKSPLVVTLKSSASPKSANIKLQTNSEIDNLFKRDDTHEFIMFMKSIPLTGERDIDEDIVKFYRLKFQS